MPMFKPREANTDRAEPFNNGPCPDCRVHNKWCFCDKFPQLKSKTPVHFLMYHREWFLTTSSVYFAHKILLDSELQFRGKKDVTPDVQRMKPENYTPLYLYPDEEAVELTPEFLANLAAPPSLIIPDGSWRQVKRFKRRVPGLSSVQSVKLPPGPLSEWHLRTSPRSDGVCTFEALARALSIIEGPEIEDSMMEFFRIMVNRFLIVRKGKEYAKDKTQLQDSTQNHRHYR